MQNEERLLAALARIAVAFEEQNALWRESIDNSKTAHEASYEQMRDWMELQKQQKQADVEHMEAQHALDMDRAEAQAREANQKVLDVYAESLKVAQKGSVPIPQFSVNSEKP